ncbi:MAG: hypothetical protein HC769_22665 [Cyanobacteria bacterium CRU_2_1]|nr:hypothetical protein [Cyanobacteria bacterium RU_5_0]NJR61387.1 hypothetical protein [Cyanobacteria bacterium CRU_2_1]
MIKLLIVVAAVVYVYGVYKFLTGFDRTNFTSGRLPLALLWPVFLIANKSYRQNFSRVLKG